MESMFVGVEEPSPRKPLLDRYSHVFVEEPTTNAGSAPIAFGLMESNPHGVVLATDSVVSNKLPPVNAVVEAYAICEGARPLTFKTPVTVEEPVLKKFTIEAIVLDA